jgi:hypothetical protein
VSAEDPDGDAIGSLVADLTGLTGAVFTPDAGDTSGTFSWTPGFADSGVYQVIFTASNLAEGRDTTVITVNPVDRAPVVETPGTVQGTEGALLTFTIHAADPDGSPITSLTANLDSIPAGATFTPDAGDTTGTFSWTPGAGQSGLYFVVFTAANALSGLDTVFVSVVAPGSENLASVPGEAGREGATGANRPIVFAANISPNPIRRQGHLTLSLPRAGSVRVDLFDVTGRHVRTLLERDDARAGVQDISFDVDNGRGGPLQSGLYLYRVTSPHGARSGTVVVMK